MPCVKGKFRRALKIATLELLLIVSGILLVRREIWSSHIFDLALNCWQEWLVLPLATIDGGITGLFSATKLQVEHLPAYPILLRLSAPIFLVLYVACCAVSERLSVGTFMVTPMLWRTLGITIIVLGIGLRVWSQVSSLSTAQNDKEKTTIVVQVAEVGSAELSAGTIELSKSGEPDTTFAAPKLSETSAGGQSDESSEVPSTLGPTSLDAAQPPSTQPEKEQVIATCAKGPYELLRYPDLTGKLLALCGLPLSFNTWLPLLAVPGIIILLKWHISDQEAFRISQQGETYLTYCKRTWNLLPYIF